MQLRGRSIAFHPYFIKTSGNRKVLTLVTTHRALKFKAMEAKLELLYLVNSSKLFLKLQYLFNLIYFNCHGEF